MKKAILMAAVACVMSMPAMAAEDAMDKTMTKGEAKMEKAKDMMSKKADAKFDKMDTDKDGMISKEEHTTAMDKMFDEADTNKDGMISKDEMKAMKMKEHEGMKKKM